MSKTKEELLAELTELESLEKKVDNKKTEVALKNQEIPFQAGQVYFIRTITYFLVGRVQAIVGSFLVFEPKTISWIADTGRFMDAINKGEFNEVEPVDVRGGVNINSITDYFEWSHDLPREQK